MAGHDGQESSRASNQGSKARPGNRRVAQWTRDYVRLPGIPDEFIAPDGAPRAVWTRFFDAFAALTPIERGPSPTAERAGSCWAQGGTSPSTERGGRGSVPGESQ